MQEELANKKKLVSERAAPIQIRKGESRSKMQSISEREEETLQFWQERKIFEKSTELRKGRTQFVFYDGPPFATGLPHYGHIMQSFAKDTILRYQTMRGKYVPRQWGWDCHGLPIENIVEQELGLGHKKDIEQYGIAKFNKEAENTVLRYAEDWKRVIARIGRWVDMAHDYRTMDWTYTESVWWVFKTLFEKGLIYEGYKSMHICPRCETTLANFEVSQGYKTITDISVIVKFPISNFQFPNTHILAWTTTPWTLPGNVALAINPDIAYVRVINKESQSGESYIFAKDRLPYVEGEFEVLEEFPGLELIGKKYKPPFDYYAQDEKLENCENGWKIYAADFVTLEEGTGIVHIAPAFGEDDMRLGKEQKLPFVQHVAMDGTFKAEVRDFAGLPVKPKDDHLRTDIEIIKFLDHNNLLFSKKKITHSYPFCWRCDTPLLNYAASSWFVNVPLVRKDLLRTNTEIAWTPTHLKEGRFGRGLETAPDWAISRSRFWGAPLPVWKCEACGEKKVAGSLADLETHRFYEPATFLLMRHGERDDTDPEIMAHVERYGEIMLKNDVTADVHLSSAGREQVAVAAKKLLEEGLIIDVIYASPFIRTRESAEIAAKTLGVPVVYDDRIQELNHSAVFDGKTVAEYYLYFEKLVDRFTKTPPGGETLNDVRRRMIDFVRNVEKQYAGKRVLVISHGDPLWVLEGALQNLSPEEMIQNRQTHYISQGEIRETHVPNYPFNEDGFVDFHRPYSDDVLLKCACGNSMRRIPEVFDCWFESGSMPYGRRHYMGKPVQGFNPELVEGFPADFIAESVEQSRGWFYSLHVLATALFKKPAYKSVLATGTILAEDGRKMSKRLKNYPDPMDIIARYGADALRLYVFLAPVIYGENMNFSEKGVDEVYKKVIVRLQNVLSFYEQYATSKEEEFVFSDSLHVLDVFILGELAHAKEMIEKALDEYRLDHASRAAADFVDVFSTVYLQYSRDRFKEEAEHRAQALGCFQFILTGFAKISAPLVPFTAEYIYWRVEATDKKESVHVEDWPGEYERTKRYEDTHAIFKKSLPLFEMGLAARSKAGIPVRQPVCEICVHAPFLGAHAASDEILPILRARLNAEKISFVDELPQGDSWVREGDVALDTTLTAELREKGMLREFVRGVQEARKKEGLKPNDRITLHIYRKKMEQDFFERYRKDILKAVHADALKFGEEDGEYAITLGDREVSVAIILNS